MITVNGININQVHVRHDGRSHGIFTQDLNLPNNNITQAELFSAVENVLDLSLGSLSGYELDVAAETNNAVIRPAAKFGTDKLVLGEVYVLKTCDKPKLVCSDVKGVFEYYSEADFQFHTVNLPPVVVSKAEDKF